LKIEETLLRIMEVATKIQELVEEGWTVERLAIEDKENEPLRVFVRLSMDGRDPEEGYL
jgi:hypothetical protein